MTSLDKKNEAPKENEPTISILSSAFETRK